MRAERLARAVHSSALRCVPVVPALCVLAQRRRIARDVTYTERESAREGRALGVLCVVEIRRYFQKPRAFGSCSLLFRVLYCTVGVQNKRTNNECDCYYSGGCVLVSLQYRILNVYSIVYLQ